MLRVLTFVDVCRIRRRLILKLFLAKRAFSTILLEVNEEIHDLSNVKLLQLKPKTTYTIDDLKATQEALAIYAVAHTHTHTHKHTHTQTHHICAASSCSSGGDSGSEGVGNSCREVHAFLENDVC